MIFIHALPIIWIYKNHILLHSGIKYLSDDTNINKLNYYLLPPKLTPLHEKRSCLVAVLKLVLEAMYE